MVLVLPVGTHGRVPDTLFQRAGYFPTDHFRHPAGSPQGEWRGPQAPAISAAFLQRRYNQPGMPDFRVAWSGGGQAGYAWRFRPLPDNRPQPLTQGVVSAHWGRPLPVYQRPLSQPHTSPSFSTVPQQQGSMDLAYSAHAAIGWRRIADIRRYPLIRTTPSVPVIKQFAVSRVRYHYPYRSNAQKGFFIPPRFVTFRTPQNLGFAWRNIGQYRFRPDTQIANNQEAERAGGGGNPFANGMSGSLAPSTSTGYRFRPDNRLSRKFPISSQHLLPFIATAPEPAPTGIIPGSLRKLPTTEIGSTPFVHTDYADAVDLYNHTFSDSVRFMRIYGLKSIADNTTG